MKKDFLIAFCAISFFSCKKQTVEKANQPTNIEALADSVYNVSLSESNAVALYQDQEDLKINCACYQLADAMRGFITTGMLQYIYAEVKNSPLDYLSYDDLFEHYPGLQDDVENYLGNHVYDQPYDFNTYANMKQAFVHNGISYEPGINMPFIEELPASFSPSAGNFLWFVPIEIDEEDLNSQDVLFAWNFADGTVTTVGVGENTGKAAIGNGKPAFGTGVNYRPGAGTPGSGSKGTSGPVPDPWPAGTPANISKIKIFSRFDSNKFSEVRLCKGYTNWDGTISWIDYMEEQDVRNVHKNDIATDIWISPSKLCNLIGNGQDVYYVYNMYEYDWGCAKKEAGRRDETGSNTYSENIKGFRKYFDEVYLYPQDQNSQQRATAYDYTQSFNTYVMGSWEIIGIHGYCTIYPN